MNIIIEEPKKPGLNDIPGAAIYRAELDYVYEMCSDAQLISKLSFGMHSAANKLVNFEDQISGSSAFLEAYINHALSYEHLLKRENFQIFKASVEDTWFSNRTSAYFLKALSVEEVSHVVVDLALAWQFEYKATYEQMMEYLAIQNVALFTAAATPGREKSFLSEDYRFARGSVECDALHELEAKYGVIDGDLFGAKTTTGEIE
ncbi:hypothetical protein GCM10008927_25210 [Amylibacter ulvae]|uniref:Uncharacterized protein n=1 Tax=Paramylibacter ulvae TaxID=1651968 RepID=A0ABQ3D4K0_9RHOB|nr:hypothetical protein [Amylibacter ulvae]GHA58525.1 hypothetical protein GCM10008927_25210 [Amylibacter ulvae]